MLRIRNDILNNHTTKNDIVDETIISLESGISTESIGKALLAGILGFLVLGAFKLIAAFFISKKIEKAFKHLSDSMDGYDPNDIDNSPEVIDILSNTNNPIIYAIITDHKYADKTLVDYRKVLDIIITQYSKYNPLRLKALSDGDLLQSDEDLGIDDNYIKDITALMGIDTGILGDIKDKFKSDLYAENTEFPSSLTATDMVNNLDYFTEKYLDRMDELKSIEDSFKKSSKHKNVTHVEISDDDPDKAQKRATASRISAIGTFEISMVSIYLSWFIKNGDAVSAIITKLKALSE